MKTFAFAAAACVLAAAAGHSRADVLTIAIPDPGTTYTGFVFPNNPAVGQEIVLARIFITLHVEPGADAADFDVDITLPITPAPGSTQLFTISGADLNWSGSGTFVYEAETTIYNGTVVSTLFGAAAFPLDAWLDEESRIELVYNVPGPGGAALLGFAGVMAVRRRRRR